MASERKYAQRLLDTLPATIATDTGRVVDCRGFGKLTIIAGAGATASVSRVDLPDATAHTTGAQNTEPDVTANTRITIDVDWPFFYVSSAGGPSRVSRA